MSDDPRHLPRHTTPTWEVELLISGVAVFAMLQLPGLLDDAMFRLQPRFGDEGRQMLTLAYLYGKGMALILAATFVSHLLLRARWIALVGVHSVYPEGIRWDRLRMGPIMRDIESARARPFAAIIERADNLATIVFALGVTLALFVLPIASAAIGISALGIAVSNLTGRRIGIATTMMTVFAIVMIPFVAAMILDRRFGGTLAADGLARRTITRVLGVYTRFGMSRTGNPIMASLGSHVSDAKMTAATIALILFALIASAISLVAVKSPQRIGNYSLFPAIKDGSRTIDASHYDDQRDAVHDEPTAYIQSSIVVGPYLRLTVPYDPQRDSAAMHGCAVPTGTDDAQAAAKLECLQTLHGAMLDGKPLADLRYEIGSDPRTDRPALVAMIDVRALAPGRHELQVAYPPKSGGKRKDDPGFDRIPFWR